MPRVLSPFFPLTKFLEAFPEQNVFAGLLEGHVAPLEDLMSPVGGDSSESKVSVVLALEQSHVVYYLSMLLLSGGVLRESTQGFSFLLS